jgi:hypothetical protein
MVSLDCSCHRLGNSGHTIYPVPVGSFLKRSCNGRYMAVFVYPHHAVSRANIPEASGNDETEGKIVTPASPASLTKFSSKFMIKILTFGNLHPQQTHEIASPRQVGAKHV